MQRKYLRTQTIVLSADTPHVLKAKGNVIAIVDASNTVDVLVSDNDRLQGLTKGATIQLVDDYEGLTLTSASNQTITIGYGYGDIKQSNNVAVAQVNTSLELGNNVNFKTQNIGSSQSVVYNPNVNRIQITLSVPYDAPCGVRLLHFSSTDNEVGYLLEQGQSITMTGKDRIRAMSAVSGETVALSCIEVFA